MTKEEVIQAAQRVADSMAERMKSSYVASVERWAEGYVQREELPDEDDFYSWSEDYDWS